MNNVKEQLRKSSIMLKASSKFFLGITSMFLVIFLWMSFARVDITTQAIGFVVPYGDSTNVGSLIAGQIVEVNVREGDTVEKGDILIKLTPTVTNANKNEIETKLNIVTKQLQIKKSLVGTTVSELEYLELEKEEAELKGSLKRINFELLHADIVSPIDGVIQKLEYKNVGSVVEQFAKVVTIIPNSKKLLIEGRLLVKDRGYVSIGQSAKIKLANQDQLKFNSIDAKIISISPDAVQSDTASWYDIELEIDVTEFTSGDLTYQLVPGIHVLIFILTGERTVLSYVTTPFHNGMGQALQER